MPILHDGHHAAPEEHPAVIRPEGGLADLFGPADATILLETPIEAWGFDLRVLVVDADPRSASMALSGDGAYRAFTAICQQVDSVGLPRPLAVRADLVPFMTEGWTIHRRLLILIQDGWAAHAMFGLWGLALIEDVLPGLPIYQSSCPMPDPCPAGGEAWLNHRVTPSAVHKKTAPARPRTWRMP